MHSVLESIKGELVALASAVKSTITSNEPFCIAHGNWTFPALTRDELAEQALSLVALIDNRGGAELGASEALLSDYPRRLVYLRGSVVPNIWGNPLAGVDNYQTTLAGLRRALEPALADTSLEAIDAAKVVRRLLVQLRALEARIGGVNSRTTNLDSMVGRIEKAYVAADQLPTDLETLEESRQTIQKLLGDAKLDREQIQGLSVEVARLKEGMDKSAEEANAIIGRCDAAYRSTTSEGLASAFAERARSLNASMWIWVAGLIVALVAGAVLGTGQLKQLAGAISLSATSADTTVWIRVLLSLLSVGGPVWFAWVATKQLGQRFRLAEDYGYKASISKAYEGYRREAALLDPVFQDRLFSSAISRLEELPLRLVETTTHGSPWHELLSSEVVRNAAKSVPDFADKVTELAKSALAGVAKNPQPPLAANEPIAVPSEKG